MRTHTYLFLLSTLCTLSFCSATSTLGLESMPLHNATAAILSHTLATQSNVRNKNRGDYQLWYQLAVPVCRALVNPHTQQPYTTAPQLNAHEQKAVDFLIAYAHNTPSLPPAIRAAAASLTQHCRIARRIPGFEEQVFSANAVTEQMRRSKAQSTRPRLTDSEHSKQKKFLHDQRVLAKQENRERSFLEKQSRRTTNYSTIDVQREKERYAAESRRLRKQKREAMKKEKYKKQHRDALTAQEIAQRLSYKQRMDLAREALRRKKR